MFDIIGAVESGTKLINGIIDRIWPNPEEADKRKLELFKAELEAGLRVQLSQLDINKTEAMHRSVFVAGWRPAVGWVCASTLAYSALIEPFARFISVVMFDYQGNFPHIDTDLTYQVLMGLLGLAGMRSFEKMKGITK